MEKGWIRGETGFGMMASVRWEPFNPGSLPGDFPSNTRLAPLPRFVLQQSPEFPALLCPSCRLIEFQFPDPSHHADDPNFADASNPE
jgi:hypothetical protein